MQETLPPTTDLPKLENQKKSLNLMISFIVVLGVILAYIAYQNVLLSQRVSQLETELSQNKMVQQNQEEPVMIEAKNGSTTTSLSDLTSEATWVRKIYTSNKQVVWDIQQPLGTTSNENGLIEGYLGLTVPYEDYVLNVELSHPRLADEPPYPESLDDWITWMFNNNHFGMVIVKQPVLDHLVTHSKTETTEIKMLSAMGIMDGDKSNTQMPLVFVFKWSESGTGTNRFRPNMIMVKSANNLVVPTETIEEFTRKFVDGINWIQ